MNSSQGIYSIALLLFSYASNAQSLTNSIEECKKRAWYEKSNYFSYGGTIYTGKKEGEDFYSFINIKDDPNYKEGDKYCMISKKQCSIFNSSTNTNIDCDENNKDTVCASKKCINNKCMDNHNTYKNSKYIDDKYKSFTKIPKKIITVNGKKELIPERAINSLSVTSN